MREVRRYVKIEPGLLPVENPAVLKPAVFSTSGGTGKEADRLLRRMAERMGILLLLLSNISILQMSTILK